MISFIVATTIGNGWYQQWVGHRNVLYGLFMLHHTAWSNGVPQIIGQATARWRSRHGTIEVAWEMLTDMQFNTLETWLYYCFIFFVCLCHICESASVGRESARKQWATAGFVSKNAAAHEATPWTSEICSVWFFFGGAGPKYPGKACYVRCLLVSNPGLAQEVSPGNWVKSPKTAVISFVVDPSFIPAIVQ